MTIIFFTIGDWGNPSISLSKIINKYADKKKPNFLCALGDNFYPFGVKNTNDSLWISNYSNLFTSNNLFCPWYVILGNHDYFRNPSAQINYYLEKKDIRWIMPSKYYNIVKEIDNKIIEIIALDTVTLCPDTSLNLLSNNIIKKENINNYEKNKQIKWFKNILKNSKADWLIVLGHYNLFSHGYRNINTEMYNIIKPLLEKYNVDMYICGHCHNLQHLDCNDVNYIVSGSFSKTSILRDKLNYIYHKITFTDSSKIVNTNFISNSNGFTIHEINDNNMKISFVDSNNTIIYETNIKQKRNI
jgi:predicted phosphodiesterase